MVYADLIPTVQATREPTPDKTTTHSFYRLGTWHLEEKSRSHKSLSTGKHYFFFHHNKRLICLFSSFKRSHKQKRLRKWIHTAQPSQSQMQKLHFCLHLACLSLPLPSFMHADCWSATSCLRKSTSTCDSWACTHRFLFFQASCFYGQTFWVQHGQLQRRTWHLWQRYEDGPHYG